MLEWRLQAYHVECIKAHAAGDASVHPGCVIQAGLPKVWAFPQRAVKAGARDGVGLSELLCLSRRANKERATRARPGARIA